MNHPYRCSSGQRGNSLLVRHDTACGGGPPWQILARLFGGGQGSEFRHRMGLLKENVSAFYEPTTLGAATREQKESVLHLSDTDLYFVETPEGEGAFNEFIRWLGLQLPTLALPSHRAGRNRAATLALEPDYLLLIPPDWRLVWASVCFPSRWSLQGKAGQSLPFLHAPVPGLNEELGRKIDTFFARLPPGEAWTRANWGLSASGEPNQHPTRTIPPLSGQTPDAEIYVRVESQHLLKLPETGAVAFGIRILNFPFAEVMVRREIAVGLKEQLCTMPAEVAEYKGIPAEFWRRIRV